MASSFEDRNISDDENSAHENGPNDEEGASMQYPENTNGPKTGPKGVLQDYKRYKQLESKQKILDKQRKLEYIKKSSMTCTSEKQDTEEEELLKSEDEFLQEYHQKRLQQLKEESEKYVLGKRPKFGKVQELGMANFIQSVDDVDVHVTVIIHIYEDISMCNQMNNCFDCLAMQYPYVKFCKILASTAGLSHKFKLNALPTLQVYKNGILIGNHIRLGDYFEEEFYAADVEGFLIENDALPRQEFNPANPIVLSNDIDDFSDSDFELD
eukprot:gene6193-6908_t